VIAVSGSAAVVVPAFDLVLIPVSALVAAVAACRPTSFRRPSSAVGFAAVVVFAASSALRSSSLRAYG
jgi:hypothetical protein